MFRASHLSVATVVQPYLRVTVSDSRMVEKALMYTLDQTANIFIISSVKLSVLETVSFSQCRM